MFTDDCSLTFYMFHTYGSFRCEDDLTDDFKALCSFVKATCTSQRETDFNQNNEMEKKYGTCVTLSIVGF